MRLYGGYATDCGTTRENNQDAIFFRNTEKRGENFALGAVCDGIGGLEHGEVASGLVIRQIAQWYDSVVEWIDIRQEDKQVMFSNLKDQAELWNETLYRYRCGNNLRTGTTMSVLMIFRDSYFAVHVGDSRIYRYRTRLEPITVDECVSEWQNGQVKKYLSNYVGREEQLAFRCYEGDLAAGDVFVFCSDGFYHHLCDADMESFCDRYKGVLFDKNNYITKACEELIGEMVSRGERDNLSGGIICIRN